MFVKVQTNRAREKILPYRDLAIKTTEIVTITHAENGALSYIISEPVNHLK